jgi:hypothetical protein
LIVAAVILARSAVFVLWPHVHFDADQAVTGLMAKHLAEGRAFPVFQYAQRYVLVLESWLAAPLIALTGQATASAIKSIPVALNVAAGMVLYGTLRGSARLGPWIAGVAILPFALPGPGTAGELTDALGMNIEPLLFTAVFWHLRQRPVPFGVVAAIATLNREFTLYALAALAAVEVLRDRRWLLDWRPRVVAIVAFALTWSAVGLLKQYSTPYGPGTTFDRMAASGDNLGLAASFLCAEPDAIARDVRAVAGRLLPLQLGLGDEPLLSRAGAGGPSWLRRLLWPLVAALLLFGVARGLLRAWRHGATPATWFGLYLVLTGAQSVIVYATLRCGHIGVGNLRYTLLALLAPVGAVALALERERLRAVRAAFVVGIGLWAGVCAVNHARFWHALVVAPLPAEHRQLAEYLLSHGHHYVITDYWTGYHVAFLTAERIKPLTDFDRVAEYALAVRANRDRAVEVRRRRDERCAGAVEIADWYVCLPSSPDRIP